MLVLAGAGLWGSYMAFAQGLLSKLVADTVLTELLGTGFGIFDLVNGGTMLQASAIAGFLWQSHKPPATFLDGVAFAAIEAIGLPVALRSAKLR